MSSIDNATTADVDALLQILGNRGRDFIRCFDVSSVWCSRYAYIVLQGLTSRDMCSYELHHIVPITYYRTIGLHCDRHHRQVCRNNLTNLSIKEHIFVHFCMVLCCYNRKVKIKLIKAFYLMYYGFHTGNHLYSEGIQNNTILNFNSITDGQVISHLTATTYTPHLTSNSHTYSEGRIYFNCSKYPLAPRYLQSMDFKKVFALFSLKAHSLVPIYNTRYLWMQKVIISYSRHIRILSIDQSIKKNIRFSDYSLHPIPKEYVARFLSICVCHRVWKDTIYDTIQYVDDYLKLPPIMLPLVDCSSSVIILKYKKPRITRQPSKCLSLKPHTPICFANPKPLPKPKPRRPIRYKRITQETLVYDEPLVMLHGRNI